MSFEIADRDLLARIGRFETKSGVVETPLLLPVINPNVQTVLPKTLEEKFGCRALITNAYIIQKNFKEAATEKGLHDFLNFKGSIMTDSGAYQLLIYKDIETSPEEIVHFQEKIDTDIATILDIPTGNRQTGKSAGENKNPRRHSVGWSSSGRTIPRPRRQISKGNGETTLSDSRFRQPNPGDGAVQV
jgi:7-cyano-7-deazaguanine tRNA-ribosyltransferase